MVGAAINTVAEGLKMTFPIRGLAQAVAADNPGSVLLVGADKGLVFCGKSAQEAMQEAVISEYTPFSSIEQVELALERGGSWAVVTGSTFNDLRY